MNEMTDNPVPQVPGNQRRTRRQRFVIESEHCDLVIYGQYVHRSSSCMAPFLRARLLHKET